jgi:Dynamin central region/Dynamin family
MGIRTDISSKTGSVFSEDTLKIEICGPHEDYLTVIDVPGIFRKHTEGITTKDDIDLVRNLVRSYVRDKRTIILAVLPANVDISTQEILALAEEYDRLGERTLGILTKPDLVTEPSAQTSVCNLVLGKRMPLSLGYYLVRNRGADDAATGEDTLDKFFQQQPWSSLPLGRIGISALRKRLEALLAEITRREFPNLRNEISEKLAECQRDLDRLGPPRPNEKEQRSYLNAIAKQFEDLKGGALAAHYSPYELFERPAMRLITGLVNLTGEFSDWFQQHGQMRHFQGPESRTCEPQLSAEPVRRASTPSTDTASVDFRTYLRDCLETYGIVINNEYPELATLSTEDTDVEDPQHGIMEWIKTLYLQSRGMDLGTFNTDLLSAAFAEQSRQWDRMVKVYMGEVLRLIHHFMTETLHAVCADDEVAKDIWAVILAHVLERYEAGMKQATLLVHIERYQPPFTLNPSFNKEVQIARGRRMKESLKDKAWKQAKYAEDKWVLNLDDVALVTETKTNAQYLFEEIHDKLQSYYRLAVDRFMDNLFRQAVSYQLLAGPASPLTVFCQKWVVELDAETLNRIAGEKEPAKKRRQILNKKSKALKEALEIINF